MSGTLRRDCFWMTIIKSNPGDEFYCEGPETDNINFNCDDCKWFITQGDMQSIFLHIIDLFKSFLPKESKHDKNIHNFFCWLADNKCPGDVFILGHDVHEKDRCDYLQRKYDQKKACRICWDSAITELDEVEE